LEIFALRRFFREPIAELLVWRASEAQRKHRLRKTANLFAGESGRVTFQKTRWSCDQQKPRLQAVLNFLHPAAVLQFWSSICPAFVLLATLERGTHAKTSGKAKRSRGLY
jgi:hypothetical protein